MTTTLTLYRRALDLAAQLGADDEDTDALVIGRRDSRAVHVYAMSDRRRAQVARELEDAGYVVMPPRGNG